MRWLVGLLQAIPSVPYQMWLAKQSSERYELRRALAEVNKQAWLNSFDANGNYLHWSGYWESLTGWVFFDNRWMWLVPQTDDSDSAWVERGDLAPRWK